MASASGESSAVGEKSEENADPTPLPAIFGQTPLWRPQPPGNEPRIVRPLAPSRPEGNVFGPTPPSRSPLDMTSPGPHAQALRRGLIMHRLLQFLPDLPEAERHAP
ncbi:MAG: hypothetical protein AAYR33_07315 [Acetobacteraceae bacterium]